MADGTKNTGVNTGDPTPPRRHPINLEALKEAEAHPFERNTPAQSKPPQQQATAAVKSINLESLRQAEANPFVKKKEPTPLVSSTGGVAGAGVSPSPSTSPSVSPVAGPTPAPASATGIKTEVNYSRGSMLVDRSNLILSPFAKPEDAKIRSYRYGDIASSSVDNITGDYINEKNNVNQWDFFSANRLEQQRLGKAAKYISDFKNGNSKLEDFQYLLQVAPKAANELIASVDPNARLGTAADVSNFVQHANRVKSAEAATSKVHSSAAQAAYVGENINKLKSIIPDLDVTKIQEENYEERIRKARLDELAELNKAYPDNPYIALAGDATAGSSRRFNQAEYDKKAAEVEKKYNDNSQLLGQAAAFEYARKNPKATPLEVGLAYLKKANPERYKIREMAAKDGKPDPDDGQWTRMGLTALYATGDQSILPALQQEEKQLNIKYPKQIIAETYNRIGAEHAKAMGAAKYIGYGSPTQEQADEYIRNMPQENREAYYKHIRSDVGLGGSLYKTPLQGAMPQMGAGAAVVFKDVGNFVLDKIGVRTEGQRAAEVMSDPYETRFAKVGEYAPAVQRLAELNGKLKKGTLSGDELKEKRDLETYTHTRTGFGELVDGVFNTTGQVVAQYLLTRGAGSITAAAVGRVGLLAGEGATLARGAEGMAEAALDIGIKRDAIMKAASSAIAYASSYDGASKQAISLMPGDENAGKRKIFTNLVAGLNAATENIFKDYKAFDALNREIAPSIVNVINKLSTGEITQQALSSELAKIMKNGLKFAGNWIKEDFKEAVEEVATSAGESAAIGFLAPAKFNLKESYDDAKKVFTSTLVDGSLVAGFAGARESRVNRFSMPIIAEIGINDDFTRGLRDEVNRQLIAEEITTDQANEKHKIINIAEKINKKDIPTVKEYANLSPHQQVKYFGQLLNESLLKGKLKTLNDERSRAEESGEAFDALPIGNISNQIKESEEIRRKIINNETYVTDEFGLKTIEEANEIEKAREATPDNETVESIESERKKELDNLQSRLDAGQFTGTPEEVMSDVKEVRELINARYDAKLDKITPAKNEAGVGIESAASSEPLKTEDDILNARKEELRNALIDDYKSNEEIIASENSAGKKSAENFLSNPKGYYETLVRVNKQLLDENPNNAFAKGVIERAESKISDIDRINAKYDAELDKLKSDISEPAQQQEAAQGQQAPAIQASGAVEAPEAAEAEGSAKPELQAGEPVVSKPDKEEEASDDGEKIETDEQVVKTLTPEEKKEYLDLISDLEFDKAQEVIERKRTKQKKVAPVKPAEEKKPEPKKEAAPVKPVEEKKQEAKKEEAPKKEAKPVEEKKAEPKKEAESVAEKPVEEPAKKQETAKPIEAKKEEKKADEKKEDKSEKNASDDSGESEARALFSGLGDAKSSVSDLKAIVAWYKNAADDLYSVVNASLEKTPKYHKVGEYEIERVDNGKITEYKISYKGKPLQVLRKNAGEWTDENENWLSPQYSPKAAIYKVIMRNEFADLNPIDYDSVTVSEKKLNNGDVVYTLLSHGNKVGTLYKYKDKKYIRSFDNKIQKRVIEDAKRWYIQNSNDRRWDKGIKIVEGQIADAKESGIEAESVAKKPVEEPAQKQEPEAVKKPAYQLRDRKVEKTPAKPEEKKPEPKKEEAPVISAEERRIAEQQKAEEIERIKPWLLQPGQVARPVSSASQLKSGQVVLYNGEKWAISKVNKNGTIDLVQSGDMSPVRGTLRIIGDVDITEDGFGGLVYEQPRSQLSDDLGGVNASDNTGISNLAESISDDNKKLSIIKQVERVAAAIKSILPNVSIHIHSSPESYDNAVASLGGARGTNGNLSFSRDNNGEFVGRIDINLEKANSRTVPHEVAQAVLLGKFGDSKEAFGRFRYRISRLISSERNKQLSEFAARYPEEVQHEEYLSELAGVMSAYGERLTPIKSGFLTKVAAAINRAVSSLTGGKLQPFGDMVKAAEVVDFFNSMADALSTGSPLVADITPVESDSRSQLSENPYDKARSKIYDSYRLGVIDEATRDEYINKINEKEKAAAKQEEAKQEPKQEKKEEPKKEKKQEPKKEKKEKKRAVTAGGTERLDAMRNLVPNSGEVSKYMSGETITEAYKEQPTNDQTITTIKLNDALFHGRSMIVEAQAIWGNDYAMSFLSYIDDFNGDPSVKALMYVSLENALAQEKLSNPDRAAEISRTQEHVYQTTQAYARKISLALNYWRLRNIAMRGYDTRATTDAMLSPVELEQRRKLEEAIQGKMQTKDGPAVTVSDMINEEALAQEEVSEEVMEAEREEAEAIEKEKAKKKDSGQKDTRKKSSKKGVVKPNMSDLKRKLDDLRSGLKDIEC